LDAGAVENFTLNGGTVDDFLRDQLDRQAIALLGIEVVHRPDDHARTFQELLFGRADAIRVEAKIGPVRKLPVPAHDR
jgi:hypothetical protein